MEEVNHHMQSDNMSALSESSSRTEHMQFLTNVMGMDTTSAAMLFRAERLQEKGQLRQALKYYESVLSKCPECAEATENIRIVKELLGDEETDLNRQKRKKKLYDIPEKIEVRPSKSTITECDIPWSGRESIAFDYYPDPDECALQAARTHLTRAGYGDSLLKLLENKTTADICNAETGWETCLKGSAVFRVTLIPDRGETLAEKVYIQALEDLITAHHSDGQKQKEETEFNPNSSAPAQHVDVPAGGAGKKSISSASRFADASEKISAVVPALDEAISEL